jgi:hypothetical protein
MEESILNNKLMTKKEYICHLIVKLSTNVDSDESQGVSALPGTCRSWREDGRATTTQGPANTTGQFRIGIFLFYSNAKSETFEFQE